MFERIRKAGWYVLDQGPLTVRLVRVHSDRIEVCRISTRDYWQFRLDRLPHVHVVKLGT